MEINSFYEFFSINVVQGCLIHLEVAAVHVRLNGAVVEDGDGHLGIRGLRAELVVRIAEGLADRVDANQSTRGKEVLALEGASSHRVLLGPDGIHVLGEELGRGELVAGVAARRGLRIAELGGARAILHRVTTRTVGVGANSGLTLVARGTVLTRLSGVIGGSRKSRLESLGTLE